MLTPDLDAGPMSQVHETTSVKVLHIVVIDRGNVVAIFDEVVYVLSGSNAHYGCKLTLHALTVHIIVFLRCQRSTALLRLCPEYGLAAWS